MEPNDSNTGNQNTETHILTPDRGIITPIKLGTLCLSAEAKDIHMCDLLWALRRHRRGDSHGVPLVSQGVGPVASCEDGQIHSVHFNAEGDEIWVITQPELARTMVFLRRWEDDF